MTSLSLFDDLRYRRVDMMGSQPRRRSATDGAPGRGRSIWRRAEPLVVDGLAGHGSVVGLTADVVVLGSGAAFYCEPLVPWRIEMLLT